MSFWMGWATGAIMSVWSQTLQLERAMNSIALSQCSVGRMCLLDE